jgi:preprotein translocase subunit YajC
MFITAAYAQTAQAPGGGNVLFQMVPFIAILVIMYFLILRPQQKKMQQHRDMVSGLKRGDVVVTAGGLIGKVTKLIGDAELQVELAEGVRVRVIRSTIGEVRTRGDVREADARKALARGKDDDDDETSAPQAANDAGDPKKDA